MTKTDEEMFEEYFAEQKEKMMVWLDYRLYPKDFLSITESMKNTLLEIWLRAGINEDQVCCYCSKPVPGRYLYCNEICRIAMEELGNPVGDMCKIESKL